MASKVNLNATLVDYDNKPMKFKPTQDENTRDCLAKDVVLQAILSPGRQANWQDHMKRDEMARKIYMAKEEVELSSEQIVDIKNWLNNSPFSPAAVAQVCRILEGTNG